MTQFRSTENTVQILPATEEHIPALVSLAGMIWRQHYPGIISWDQIEYMLGKMYSPITLKEEFGQPAFRMYRLLVDSRFVGYCSVGPLYDRGVMKLHKCYLLPEFHGRGLGSLLLRYCEAEVREFGARRLVLSVNKRNSKAIAAYQRNGFEIIKSVVTHFGHGFMMDDYLMAKNIK